MSIFTVSLDGEQWWKVVRILTGEAPAEGLLSPIANDITAQLWDTPEEGK